MAQPGGKTAPDLLSKFYVGILEETTFNWQH